MLELRGDGKAVVVAGNVRMVVPVESLTPAAEEARKLGGWEAREGKEPSLLASQPPSPSEIDLRGTRVDEAEAQTLAADLPFLRIIHGMRTGAVRDTVRRVLAADRRVTKFDFAPRNQGGTGVTIAEFGS